ncbi:hypothetical protein [Dactylosporangium salmoneum]|uniref:LPXTG-motif cell wall anchor domain-containing protein n=1 Tax=Dactylosporangium salmoneum TaxID=53361 RepID=A0ABN3HD09_9ACTN
MEAPTGRRTRWRLRAGSFVLLATVSSILFAAAAHADPPDGGDPNSPTPVETSTSTETPTQGPTTEGPPPPTTTQAPPPPTTTQAPPPPPAVHRFKMTVSTVSLGDQYWQGDGSAELVIAIKNTGEHVGRDTITGFYAFPTGSQATGAYGTGGCTVVNGSLSFACALGEQDLGQIVVKVNVDQGAWKTITTGLVTAAAGPIQRTAPIAFAFTTPPTPGIALEAQAAELPAAASPQDGATQLGVRLRNTGASKASGAIEVVTPPGVDLVAFPSACRSHRRIAADRDRCELGDIAAGKEVSAVFGLAVSAAARAELPLTGTVHAYLTPPGQDTVESRYDFKITAPALAGAEAPLPTSAPASPPPQPSLGDLGMRRQSSDSGKISSLPYIGGIAGLVLIAGALVFFSLRRRGRHDEDALPADEVEDVVLVPAQRAGDLPPSTALPRSPIPRALNLPRLPTGPVAGSGFREPIRLDGDGDEDRKADGRHVD